MKSIARLAGLGGVALAASMAMTVPPASATPASSISFGGGTIAGGGGAATLSILYTCTGGGHLFVGLKQGEGLSTDVMSPGNSTETNPNIRAFYSTNWKSDVAPNALKCDGTQQKQQMVLKPQPGFTPTANLVRGPALLQLCMFDAGSPPEGTLSYTMENVTAGVGRG